MDLKSLIILVLLPIVLTAQTQIGLDLDGEAGGDNLGISVALSSDGTIVAFGAYFNDGNGADSGHTRVYQNISGTWTKVGADIDGEASGDNSGISVSVSSDGTIIAIGAPGNDGNGVNAGQARIYQNISGTWTQIGSDIDGEAAGDNLGTSVSISSDGATVAIGARFNNDNGSFSGHVRIYQNVSGTWTKIGADIDGEAATDYSGYSVSLSSDGTTVAIGAYANDGVNGINSGHVRVYKNITGTWTQIGSDIDGEAAGDQSGFSVSISSDGTIVAIGASNNDGNGTDSGHVRVYQNISETWTQIGSDIDGEAINDSSGASVRISSNGNILTIGAPFNDAIGTSSGHVRVYQNISGIWTQIGTDIDGEAAGDNSGNSVVVSPDGATVAVGAYQNDTTNGANSGHVRVYDISTFLSSTNTLELSKFSIYPNPVKDQFTIQLKSELLLKRLQVYNHLGQLLLTTQKKTVTTTHLASGLYYVKVITNKGKAIKKIVVE